MLLASWQRKPYKDETLHHTFYGKLIRPELHHTQGYMYTHYRYTPEIQLASLFCKTPVIIECTREKHAYMCMEWTYDTYAEHVK